MTSEYKETENPALTGIKGLCPQCQRGHLFKACCHWLPLARFAAWIIRSPTRLTDQRSSP